MDSPIALLPKRLLLMLLAMLALLAALWSGLLRIGWAGPLLQSTLPMAHGPPMVSGFLGTLISLERAVALGRRWGCAAPLLTVRLIGDSAGLMALRRWGGLINAAAILFFLTTMVYSMIHRPAPVASDPVEL